MLSAGGTNRCLVLADSRRADAGTTVEPVFGVGQAASALCKRLWLPPCGRFILARRGSGARVRPVIIDRKIVGEESLLCVIHVDVCFGTSALIFVSEL